MSVMELFVNECNEVTTSYDDNFTKICTFIEASIDTLNTNLKKAKLKVFEENGTFEDYIYLEDKATEETDNRIVKAVKTMIENLKTMIKGVIEKVTNFFNTSKSDEKIEKVKKASKTNPKLKDKKIKSKDIEEVNKAHKEYDGKLKRILAKLKVRKTESAAEKEEIAQAKEIRNAKIKNAENVEMNLDKVCDNIVFAKNEILSCEEMNMNVTNIDGSDQMNNEIIDIVKELVTNERDRVNSLSVYVQDNIKSIQVGLHENPSEEKKEESKLEANAEETPIEESTLSAGSYLEELENELGF